MKCSFVNFVAFLMCVFLFSCGEEIDRSLLVQMQEDESAANITLFCVSADDGLTYNSTISETNDPLGNAAIEVRIPSKYDIAQLAPLVLTNTGAQYTPIGAQDFSNSGAAPIPYTVTAANGSEKTYMVSVVVDDSVVVNSNASVANVSFKSFEMKYPDSASTESFNRAYTVLVDNQKNKITVTIDYQYDLPDTPDTIAPDSYLDKMLKGTSIEVDLNVIEPDNAESAQVKRLPFGSLHELHYKAERELTLEDSLGRPKTYSVAAALKPPLLGATPATAMASGGEVSFVTNANGTKDEVHVFKSDGSLVFNPNYVFLPETKNKAWILLVAGGGAGANSGGGAGGVLDSSYGRTSNPYTFKFRKSFDMVIGKGGTVDPNGTVATNVKYDYERGTNGGNTLLKSGGTTIFEMIGGGCGGGTNIPYGASGGSGGGSYYNTTISPPAAGTQTTKVVDSVSYQVLGNSGYDGTIGSGGGAMGVGKTGASSSGGEGYELKIKDGTGVYYGRGGNMSLANTLPNTGNGGSANRPGADGIVIVRFPYTRF
ncbi:MAG: hypothetical protein Ta2B_01640 [Termitinemataceae bacterium]|nr:MAG: hypothetical protein Ta2B_01640 [Termitinemataceae bacterium]